VVRWGRRATILVSAGVAVLATTGVGAPALANEKPPTTAATRAHGPVPAGFADWSAVYAFQTRLNAAAERLMAAGDAGNASIVADPRTHELRVYWKGAVPADVRTVAAGLDVPVAFHAAAFTHRELVAGAKRLAADPRVFQAAPEPDGSGLAVTVPGTTHLTDQAALSTSAALPLHVTVGTRPQAMTGRQADTEPFWGGSRFNTNGPCSNGIPVKMFGAFHMMTAGHCGENGTAANVPGQPTPTGTIFGKSTCRDTELVSYSGQVQPRIYTGEPTGSSSVQIVGATPDFVGNLVNTGGASSGEHFNIPVAFTDVFDGVGGIPCGDAVGPLTLARYDDLTACAVTFGDSGGPVYTYTGRDLNTTVFARGTITGGATGASCPGAFPNGGHAVLYAPLVRPAGDSEFGSLGFYGAEPPATTSFDLNGTWRDGPGRPPGPVITVLDREISVDMSAFHRPRAFGSVIDSTHITVTFPDDATFTGTLGTSRNIQWSNGSAWLKL
jgi:hypothetical protein